MKKYDVVDLILSCGAILAIGVAVGLTLGSFIGKSNMRRRCIKAGVAKWINNEAGAPKLVFKSLEVLK